MYKPKVYIMKKPNTNLVHKVIIRFINRASRDVLLDMRESLKRELRNVKSTQEQKDKYYQELQLINYNLTK